MPEIIVRYEDKVIERVVTEKHRISVGRTNDNDIVLENRGVSRKHAVIEFNSDGAVVMDNESLNGTFVNNRRISEEHLRENDTVTIGKYTLVYFPEASNELDTAAMDGTMMLNTKAQKELLENDRRERDMVAKYGGSLLPGEDNATFSEFHLEREVTTIGKAKFVHVQAKGFFISSIQAKLVRENDQFYLINLGKSGRTKLNGSTVERERIKNGDLITVGKSTFRFVEGNS